MAVPPHRQNPYAGPAGRPGFQRSRPISHSQVYRRPAAITVLAVLNFIGGPITLLAGVVVLFGVGQMEPEARGLVTFLALLYVVFGVLGIVTAIGLLRLKRYGRILQMIASFIGLLAIPVGTVISAVILWYLFKPGVQVLFSERPVAQLSQWEIREVQQLQQSSAAVILLAIVLPIALIAFVGIVAAIAIPSLLRARISANEASALSDVQQIVSAQVTYSRANGGQFDSLECLASPQTCLPGYPPEGPVFLSGLLTGAKNGYQREFYRGAPSDTSDTAFANLSPSSVASFVFVAYPISPGLTGVRSFCGDSAGMVCAMADGRAPDVSSGYCPADCLPFP